MMENAITQLLKETKAKRLTRSEAAEFLGLKEATLAVDACTRRLGVPFYKIGSRVFYDLDDLKEFRNARRVPAGTTE
jgi:hypothetical protein